MSNAKKKYIFTIKFGRKTDTADISGTTIGVSTYIPNTNACKNVCNAFIGQIKQVPPAYSAIKINGKRAYKLARQGDKLILPKRKINIFSLDFIKHDIQNGTASYICECSKGTYIRTLAEDIALSLQTLGFVLELKRVKVGTFTSNNSVNINELQNKSFQEIQNIFYDYHLKIESVLDDIPVFDVDSQRAQKIYFGQKVHLDSNQDLALIWVRHQKRLIAIGSLQKNNFNSSKVFNKI